MRVRYLKTEAGVSADRAWCKPAGHEEDLPAGAAHARIKAGIVEALEEPPASSTRPKTTRKRKANK